MTVTASTPVLVLWWIALAVTVLAIVPVALLLLRRGFNAARMIRVNAAETLEAARGILDNAAAIAALDETIEAAGPIAEKAARLEDATARIESILQQRTA